jgi:hypothetical protein
MNFVQIGDTFLNLDEVTRASITTDAAKTGGRYERLILDFTSRFSADFLGPEKDLVRAALVRAVEHSRLRAELLLMTPPPPPPAPIPPPSVPPIGPAATDEEVLEALERRWPGQCRPRDLDEAEDEVDQAVAAHPKRKAGGNPIASRYAALTLGYEGLYREYLKLARLGLGVGEPALMAEAETPTPTETPTETETETETETPTPEV